MLEREYKCPECSSIEDDQYTCMTCAGAERITLQEARNLEISLDDLEPVEDQS